MRLTRETNITNIIDVEFLVCGEYKISPEELHTEKKKRTQAEARQVIIYICLTLELARNADLVLFYKRDHTSIIHAAKTIKGFLSIDKRFSNRIEELLHKSKVITSYMGFSNFDL